MDFSVKCWTLFVYITIIHSKIYLSSFVFVPYSWRRSQHLELKRGILKTGRFYRKKRKKSLGFTVAPVHLIPREVRPLLIHITYVTSPFLNEEVRGGRVTSSKVQGPSVGSWETARWKFQALIEKPFGSESHQTIPKWFDNYRLVIVHKKILCIIVPNRRTASLESLLFVFCLLFRLCLRTLVLPLLPNRLYPNMCPITVKTRI